METMTTPTDLRDRPRPPSRRWWALDPGGAALGLFAAMLAMTPSLLPRSAMFQGVVAAVAFAVGYLLGAIVWAVLRRLLPVRIGPAVRRGLWIGYGVAWLAAAGVLSVLATGWQDEVRRMVEMAPLDGADLAGFAVGFLPLTVLLIAIGRGVRRMHRALRGRIGAPVAVLLSASVVLAGVAALTLVVSVGMDRIYLDRNAHPSADLVEPSSAHRSAGSGSAIRWQDVGRHGGAFLAGGPDAAEIAALTGHPAKEPIRVYAGLESAPTVHERAALAVRELERTGAFDRSVLVVATTTGSGWLEPQAMDSVEYLHGGDTAIVALQYAYTPSWVSFVFDPDAPVEAARVLFDAVEAHWKQLPADHRPRLVVYGLSLGAHGGQAVFSDVGQLRARTDGALFVGSPAGSELWRALQSARDDGSPAWQPVLDGGREVRWISREGDQNLLPGPWEQPRVLYLQHATDAVTWLAPDLIWRAPEWLEPGQRGPDVSPQMRWIPVVTAVQVTIDMLGGEAVPARHGHNFGDVMTTGWREVTGDGGLDDQAVARIAAKIATYAPIQPVEP